MLKNLPKEIRAFALPLPPRNNRYYRTNRGHVHLSSEGRAYKAIVASKLRDMQPLEGDLEVRMTIYRKIKSGDMDGFFKGLFDAIQGYALVNDSQIKRLLCEMKDDKNNPRIEMILSPLGGSLCLSY